jgi:hypothetical protein
MTARLIAAALLLTPCGGCAFVDAILIDILFQDRRFPPMRGPAREVPVPLTADDLVLCGSANMPADDVSATGGAASPSTRLLTDDLPAATTLRLVGTDAADTARDYTVSGADGVGAPASEVLTLAGTTPVIGAQLFASIRRVAKTAGSALAGSAIAYRSGSTAVDADAPAGGTVLPVADTAAFAPGMRVIVAPSVPARRELGEVASVQAGVSITLRSPLAHTHTAAQADAVHVVVAELPGAAGSPTGAEITLVKKPFESAASGPAQTVRYEKVFLRNRHASLTLSAAAVRLAEAPTADTPATTVNADSRRGTADLFVAATTGFAAGDVVVIAAGTARAETATVSAVDPGVRLQLAEGLVFDHLAADADAVRPGRVAIAAAGSRDDSGSVADRLTAPGGLSFGGGSKPVAGGVHPSGSGQGIWLRLTLPADAPAFRGRLVLEETGRTSG